MQNLAVDIHMVINELRSCMPRRINARDGLHFQGVSELLKTVFGQTLTAILTSLTVFAHNIKAPC